MIVAAGSINRRTLFAMGAMSVAAAALRAAGLPAAAAWASSGATQPDVDILLTAAPGDVSILPGRATAVWRFTGEVLRGPASALESVRDSYLGPTLRLRRGQHVRIRFRNRLPDPSIVHWHGLDVPEEADGHPRFAVPGGSDYVYEFQVTNRAGTYWYHPHAHMQTGPQVYRGLAGLMIISDDDEPALPSGPDELLWVLQDRRFDRGNQLVYATGMMDRETGFLGDRVLVNGRDRPAWELATRAYRVRVLNGSNARIYKLAWNDGTPMTVLGSDGGLLERPLVQQFVTLAPAQRVELWLDLSGRAPGTMMELKSAAFPSTDAGMAMGGGMGMGMGMGGVSPGSLPLGAPMTLASLTVARADAAERHVLPGRLSSFAPTWQPAATAPVRQLPLTFQRMQWSFAGRTFELAGVASDETVLAGSTHVWELANTASPMGMRMAHPIHLHGRQFRVLSRSGGDAANALREGLVDAGWLDTVLVLPGETVRIQVTFTEHPGLYLYHCHILEHEDAGMMRNLRVVSTR